MHRLLALAALTSACTHRVNTSYLQAAEIDVPQNVHTVLVIDRSQPKNVGEHMLAGAEGAMTGERFYLDAESAALALQTLQSELQNAPRFQVVRLAVNGQDVDTSLWDQAMAAERVQQLCASASCDAVIALEALDSDTLTTVERTGDRYSRAERDAARKAGECEDRACTGDYTYTAEQQTDVVATFRMYDGQTGAILDEQRATYTDQDTAQDGDHAEDALDDLPFEGRVFDGAASLGASYAARVSPTQVLASRRVYSAGHPALKLGRKQIQQGLLAEAIETWTEGLEQTAEPKKRARFLHNLAVAAEMQGDLGRAIRLSKRAQAVGQKAGMRLYLRQLNQRSANDQRVAIQLGGI